MNYTAVQAPNTACIPKLHKNYKLVLEIWLVNHNVVPGSTKMLTQEHVALGNIRLCVVYSVGLIHFISIQKRQRSKAVGDTILHEGSAPLEEQRRSSQRSSTGSSSSQKSSDHNRCITDRLGELCGRPGHLGARGSSIGLWNTQMCSN